MKRSYRELKLELTELLDWFEQDDLDIDLAIEKHAEAEKLIEQLQTYLTESEDKTAKTKRYKKSDN